MTIYAAYLEEQIDKLLFLLEPLEPFPVEEQKRQISWKLAKARRVVAQLVFEDRDALLADLDTCGRLFERRNEVVHGRIYGDPYDRPATLKSGRPNVPDRNVNSAELFELANTLDDARSAILRPTLFQIPRALP